MTPPHAGSNSFYQIFKIFKNWYVVPCIISKIARVSIFIIDTWVRSKMVLYYWFWCRIDEYSSLHNLNHFNHTISYDLKWWMIPYDCYPLSPSCLTVDPLTLKGRCSRRLCGRERVFVGPCNDTFECGRGGRKLFCTAYGDQICDCPTGDFLFDFYWIKLIYDNRRKSKLKLIDCKHGALTSGVFQVPASLRLCLTHY